MDREFAHPVRLGYGETVVILRTAQEVGAFLLQEWPRRRHRRKAYDEAIQACVRDRRQG